MASNVGKVTIASQRLRVLAWPGSSGERGNPYIDLLYGAMPPGRVSVHELNKRAMLRERWDILHLHWPEWAVRTDTRWHSLRDTLEFLGLIRLARARGARLVWTAHDLGPHDAAGSALMPYFRAFARQVDFVIALSHHSLEQVRSAYPNLRLVPSAVIPHGHYRTSYPSINHSRAEARSVLDLHSAGRVLLLIGQIRPYKNAENLIRLFRGRAGRDDLLVVAGAPIDGEIADRLREAAGTDRRIRLHLHHIEAEDVSTFLCAADVVVLPYQRILNSGAALLALSFNRPILAPQQGSLLELERTVGASWVHLFQGNFSEEHVDLALTLQLPTDDVRMDELSWPALALQTVDAFCMAKGHHLDPRVDRRVV